MSDCTWHMAQAILTFLCTRLRALGAMILQIAYGLDVKSLDDEYMRLAQEGNDIFMEAFVPGKYLVETFPILKKIPAWFPGAKFQREAAQWKKAYGAVRTKPFDATMNMMVSGLLHRSWRTTSQC